MTTIPNRYRLLVPGHYGDGRLVPSGVRDLIEDRMRERFGVFDCLPVVWPLRVCGSPCCACVVYEVAAVDRNTVVAQAREIGRLLLVPAVWVFLPNGRACVVPIDTGFFYGDPSQETAA